MGYRTVTFEEHEYLSKEAVQHALRDDTAHLQSAITQGLKTNAAVKRKGNTDREQFNVDMIITGKNGKKYTIQTGWTMLDVSGIYTPHLTTGWLYERSKLGENI